jgi:hypothetical protein
MTKEFYNNQTTVYQTDALEKKLQLHNKFYDFLKYKGRKDTFKGFV